MVIKHVFELVLTGRPLVLWYLAGCPRAFLARLLNPGGV